MEGGQAPVTKKVVGEQNGYRGDQSRRGPVSPLGGRTDTRTGDQSPQQEARENPRGPAGRAY